MVAGISDKGKSIYPAIALLAPERRFGVRDEAINIDFRGQINHVGKDGSNGVRPLDLRSGVDNEIVSPDWGNVVISGGVFGSRASTEGLIALESLATRKGISLEPGSPVGGIPRDFQGELPTKEQYEATQERYGELVDQTWQTPLKAPLSTFSVDVDTASYTNVRRMLREGRKVPKDAVRLEEFVNYFDYGYVAPSEGGPFAVHVDLATCPWAEKHHLVKIGIKGKEVDRGARPDSNLVFLIDVSGSMQSPDKLPLLIESVKALVEGLDERDSVGIVVYAGAAGTVLPPTNVAGDGRTIILRALDRLAAGGSTAGAAGIEGAYELAAKHYRKDGVNRVILATDGDFNVGISGQGPLVELVKQKAESGVFLSVLGFGTGNLNDSMMEAITNAGNGNYFYIDSQREGRKVLLQDLSGTLVAIAKDVKVQVEFNPAKVAAYRLLGYANRVLRDEDFNNDKVDAGDIGAGHSVTALYEIVPVGVIVPVISEVDSLKYQKPPAREIAKSPEWLAVKLRYKKPDGEKSSLLEVPVKTEPLDWKLASPDFLFASAVALFGERLRDSKQIGGASWKTVRDLATRGMSKDSHGYRKEFVGLVDTAARLDRDEDPVPDHAEPVEAPEAK